MYGPLEGRRLLEAVVLAELVGDRLPAVDCEAEAVVHRHAADLDRRKDISAGRLVLGRRPAGDAADLLRVRDQRVGFIPQLFDEGVDIGTGLLRGLAQLLVRDHGASRCQDGLAIFEDQLDHPLVETHCPCRLGDRLVDRAGMQKVLHLQVADEGIDLLLRDGDRENAPPPGREDEDVGVGCLQRLLDVVGELIIDQGPTEQLIDGDVLVGRRIGFGPQGQHRGNGKDGDDLSQQPKHRNLPQVEEPPLRRPLRHWQVTLVMPPQ